MEDRPNPLPAVHQQLPSVDFIQNRLSRTLDVVKGASVYYNPQSDRFEPLKIAVAAMPSPSTREKACSERQEDEASSGREMIRNRRVEPPVREPVPAVQAMLFWNAVLKPAMAQFIDQNQPEPKKLVKQPQYSIRAKEEWQDIHESLQSAQDVFNAVGKPMLRRFKYVYRKVADHTGTAQEVIVQLPDDGTYLSVVKSVLGLLLGTLKDAAQARMKAVGFASGEDIKKGFSKVEIFLAAFPGDQNIMNASVNLIASVLKAVESAILYFLSNAMSRATVGTEKQDLIDSIDQIPSQTKELMERVEESHIWGQQKALGLTLASMFSVALSVPEVTSSSLTQPVGSKPDIEELRLVNIENSMAISLKTDHISNQGREILLRLDSVGGIIQEHMQQFTKQQEDRDAQSQADILNNMKTVLDDYFHDYTNKIITELRQEMRLLSTTPGAALDAFDRSHCSATTSRNPSPGPEQQQSPSQRPPQNPYGPPTPWPQDPSVTYQQQQQQQQQELYPQNTSYLASPLPAHAHAQYYQHLLPIYPPPVPEPTSVPVNALLSAFGSFCGLDKRDMQSALSESESIPIPYRLRAQEIIQAREFRAWATAPSARELLILGDASLAAVRAGVAVSLVTASLVERLRARGAGFAALVFFCGLHTRHDDAHAGAAAMIRALIAQLLEQHYVGYQLPEGDLGLSLQQLAGGDAGTTAAAAAADLARLCALFEWLVRWLPRDKTLVVVVDGIDEYEKARFKEGMLVVLRCLLGLVAAGREGKRQGPVVKVLATCPTGTICLQKEFKSSGPAGVLLMEALQIENERMDIGRASHQRSTAGAM